ncbi:conserved hypothetical protein [Methylobacterium sp. 4-46]|uniref:GDYXXLXY domain-containing protein n=1 Tax=unclassified Methylobacterium TaxID=2615210 RepID=UPI000152D9C7|nr:MULTISPECIES: GDYXXLXY domain-containing protein [Methylobacterium]ACA16700.1 conserved hypothetical protein [Methylobacterium sp. 4-46]WFT82400.1 GDYXXLXY domain-containing protein [Methylobacterium nodulans]
MIRDLLPRLRGAPASAALFGLVFLVQALPAVTVAVEQSRRLTTGRPVLLATATRDPRDLLRGEYSVLSYEIGQPANLPAAPDLAASCPAQGACPLAAGTTVYVTLVPGEDGLSRAAAVAAAPPADGALALRGTVRFGTLVPGGSAVCPAARCLAGAVTYGIERWYGPQGAPAALDRLDRGRIRIRARVDAAGGAVLDAVLVDGREVARTPRL